MHKNFSTIFSLNLPKNEKDEMTEVAKLVGLKTSHYLRRLHRDFIEANYPEVIEKVKQKYKGHKK